MKARKKDFGKRECSVCGGSGFIDGNLMCMNCMGEGKDFVPVNLKEMEHRVLHCLKCGGTGFHSGKTCPDCQGIGKVKQKR